MKNDEIHDLVIDRIKLRMKETGVSRADLAERMGLSVEAINQWLYKKRTPSIQNLFRLADALECKPAYFIEQ